MSLTHTHIWPVTKIPLQSSDVFCSVSHLSGATLQTPHGIGDPAPARRPGDSTGPCRSSRTRVLLPSVCGSKDIGGLESHSRPKNIEPLHKIRRFKMHSLQSILEGIREGNHLTSNGFDGGIPPCPHSASSQTVSALLLCNATLSVQGPSIRTLIHP